MMLKAFNAVLQPISDLKEKTALTNVNTLHYAGEILLAGMIVPSSSETFRPVIDSDTKI